MSNNLYRVVFQGQVRAGSRPEKVREEVARLLHCDKAIVSQLFSGRTIVIKDRLELQIALDYKAVFEKTGALFLITSVDELSQAQSAPIDLTCPKCGLTQTKKDCCVGCGVFIEKYLLLQLIEQESSFDLSGNGDDGMSADDAGVAPFSKSVSCGLTIKEFLLPINSSKSKFTLLLMALLLLVLLCFWVRFAFSPISENYAGQSFMYWINLPFHEAGRVIFRIFGLYMSSFGGPLTQILIPLICLGVLLVQTRDAFGAGVCLWWTGQNFIELAPYINNARSGVWPLVAGKTGQTYPYGFSDWEFILAETGLLNYDQALARFAHCFGSVMMLLGIVWGGVVLYRNFRSRLSY